MDIDKIKLTKEQAKVMDDLYNIAQSKGYVKNLDGAFGFKIGYMIAFDLLNSSLQLPCKEEIVIEGDKQIIDWLEGSTENEKKHYRVGFRRSFEYIKRSLSK